MKRAEVIIVLICMERNTHTFWLFEDLILVAIMVVSLFALVGLCWTDFSALPVIKKYSVLTDNLLLPK